MGKTFDELKLCFILYVAGVVLQVKNAETCSVFSFQSKPFDNGKCTSFRKHYLIPIYKI